MSHPTPTTKQTTGFVMPSVLIMMTVMSLIAFATLQLVASSLNVAKKQSYIQMARVASKSAVDYAKEQFESDPNYDGTDETEILNVGDYRITFSVTVVSTSADGLEKDVQAYGNVYVPEGSGTAQFVRDIKATIVRVGTVTGTPGDFSPVLWLDSSDATTLLRQNSTSITRNPSSTVEEKTNGDVTSAAWTSDDLEMPAQGEMSGNQHVGLVFDNVAIPQGATITNAYVQFTTDETKQAGSIAYTIRGIDRDNTPNFTQTNNQIQNAPDTSASASWSPSNWNTVGQSGSAQRTTSLTSVVQEIVDRSGWASGNRLGLTIKKNGGGSGVRTAEKAANYTTLYVEWQGGGLQQATNGQSVTQWNDKSGHGYNAIHTYGVAPIKRDNQQNSLPTVEFDNNGAMLSTITSAVSGNSITGFLVTNPHSGTTNDGRFISLMNSGQSQDYNTTSGIALFHRRTNTNNLGFEHNNSLGPVTSGGIGGGYQIIAAQARTGDPDFVRRNGSETQLTINNSFTNINQIYTGGRRCSSSGCEYIDGYIAEAIVYDYALTCPQIKAIENYLSTKWNITVSSSTCPSVPVGPVN